MLQDAGNRKSESNPGTNRSIILRTIRNDEPISRIKMAKKNRINPAAVTIAVRELILRQGLVYENGIGGTTGGRNPILARFYTGVKL